MTRTTAMPTPLPEMTGQIHGSGYDGRYRVLTVEHVPFERFPSYGNGGPSTVVVNGWSVSTSSLSPLSSPSVVAADDGKITLNVRAVSNDPASPVERHPLDGTKYDDERAAKRAAYNAGLLGFMVYTKHIDQLGLAFRFTRHTATTGNGCLWSHVSVVAPESRNTPGNRRCPDDCPGSDIEIDPDDDEGSSGELFECERCETRVIEDHFDPDAGLCDECSDYNASRVVL